MQTIKSQFLYTDEEKYVPIQFLKTNYGFSSPNPDISTEVNEILGGSQKLDIEFPFNTSSVVFLVNKLTETITDVKSTIPGGNTVRMELERGVDYWIYVTNQDSDNGYLRTDFFLDSEVNRGNRATVGTDVEGTPLKINLSLEGRLPKSLDETDAEQWYPYNDYYDGELIWESPTIGDGIAVDDENYWLIVKRHVLLSIENIFVRNDVTTFDQFDWYSIVRLIRAIDEIAQYINDEKERVTNIVDDKLDDLFNFLNVNLFGYDSTSTWYVKYQPIGDMVDGMLVLGEHVSLGNIGWTVGDYQGRKESGRNTAARNEEKNPTTGADGSPPTPRRYYNQYRQGSEIRHFIEGIYEDTPFVDSPGVISGLRGYPSWDDYAVVFDYIRAKYRGDWDTWNELLEEYRLPQQGTQWDWNTKWMTAFGSVTNEKYNNVYKWVKEELEQNTQDIIDVGETIWPTRIEGIVELLYPNFPYDYNWGGPTPDVPPTVDPTQWEELWVDIRQHIEFLIGLGAEIPDPEPDVVWKGLEGWSGSQAWTEFYNWYMATVQEVRDRDEDDEEDEEIPEITGGTTPQYLGQLAIMENIRFLKNLNITVEDDLWNIINNTNTILVNKLIGIEEALGDSAVANSIFNITSTEGTTAEVEIVHTLANVQEWEVLDNTILSDNLGEVKVLDLSGEKFETVGKHIIYVRPAKLDIEISSHRGNIVTVPESLNSYRHNNAFYGWNIEFFDPSGLRLGEQRMIVASHRNEAGQHLQISPFIDGDVISVGDNIRAKIWSNSFIPVLIDLDIVEHTPKTLSYNMYSTKEINTETGVCIIYDYNGNVYKTLSLGTYATDESDRAIIEYRTPFSVNGPVTDINDLTKDDNLK